MAGECLHRVVSRAAQASVNALREIVDTFLSGSAPAWPTLDASNYMNEIRSKSIWFATWATPDDADGSARRRCIGVARTPSLLARLGRRSATRVAKTRT
jgi:hypothetical protein